MPDPTAADATRILADIAGQPVRDVRRFPNGLAHFVFDATLADGEHLVVRLTRAEQRDEFAGAVYWHPRLVKLGVPLPRLLYADVRGDRFGAPVMLLERLPGVDLGDCYLRLASGQKRQIARCVVAMQRAVSTLPAGPGFGYATSYDDPTLKPAWIDVLLESLDRARANIRDAGVITEEPVDRVQALLERFESMLDVIEPLPFLHDTTTKNVLIDHGALTGIVDVDSLCFGDPLWVLALTNMAMRSAGFDDEYVEFWADELGLHQSQRHLLALYTAVHCAYFLSEIGQRFNKDVPPPVDPRRVVHLEGILDDLLNRIER